MEQKAIRAGLVAAFGYLIAGIVFGALAGSAASHQMVVAWRLAAWLFSAGAFAGHIAYEHIRQHSAPATTAARAALAASLAGFGLAVAANLHARAASPEHHSTILVLSLVIWPAMIFLPAFIVAFLSALVLGRVRRAA